MNLYSCERRRTQINVAIVTIDRRTLPDEAKNREKQISGRLGQKKRNFAAFSATPKDGSVEIILNTDGRLPEFQIGISTQVII
jgi:hypothetical protein